MGTLRLRSTWLLPLFAAWTLTGLPGCGSDATQPGTTPGAGATAGSGATPGGGSGGSSPGTALDPGVEVSVVPSLDSEQETARIDQLLSEIDGLDAAGLKARFSTAFAAAPSYDVAQVAGLDKIQASALALNQAELGQLGERGFVLTDNRAFPSFAYGYSTIYLEDLPVYISADSILDAVHRSYDDMLEALEQQVLSSELDQLLSGMHQKLSNGLVGAHDAGAVKDADLFVAVARSLLAGKAVAPVAGASAAEAKTLFELAQAAEGTRDVTLFGVLRQDEDFSQFEPRGHYTDTPALSRYFKAMMWLGRVDLRLLETQPSGEQLFRRRQLDAMLLLADLVGEDLRPHFDSIDRTVGAFVGEPDYMTLPQVGQLLSVLGAGSSADVAALPDATIAQAIIDGGFGAQRISSQILVSDARARPLPLSRSFALLGQRYVLDSHVFSNVVYDRVSGDPMRMMPSPLDAAFAALGNDQAAELLAPELAKYEASGYPEALAKMRVLADEHPAEFWEGSLYNEWLSALRELSPRATSSAEDAASLFPVARSEAWGRRLVNTQLASWAQLRHDTILYAKQSYTGGATCDFPDGYVDPYPGFYAALSGFGARGQELVAGLQLTGTAAVLGTAMTSYFEQLSAVTEQLRAIAEHERSGAELTPEMLAFINEAVVVQLGCGSPSLESGWYKRLFFQPYSAVEEDPTIADVHTQPTDEGGGPVGRVLHVGTGNPRLMVVVAEGCSGPRAYAGLASSYREKVTENFQRLTDEVWKTTWLQEPEPSWMTDLVSGGSPVTR
jgi:hypothetical protein